jgi:hypothetical protein
MHEVDEYAVIRSIDRKVADNLFISLCGVKICLISQAPFNGIDYAYMTDQKDVPFIENIVNWLEHSKTCVPYLSMQASMRPFVLTALSLNGKIIKIGGQPVIEPFINVESMSGSMWFAPIGSRLMNMPSMHSVRSSDLQAETDQLPMSIKLSILENYLSYLFTYLAKKDQLTNYSIKGTEYVVRNFMNLTHVGSNDDDVRIEFIELVGGKEKNKHSWMLKDLLVDGNLQGDAARAAVEVVKLGIAREEKRQSEFIMKVIGDKHVGAMTISRGAGKSMFALGDYAQQQRRARRDAHGQAHDKDEDHPTIVIDEMNFITRETRGRNRIVAMGDSLTLGVLNA